MHKTHPPAWIDKAHGLADGEDLAKRLGHLTEGHGTLGTGREVEAASKALRMLADLQDRVAHEVHRHQVNRRRRIPRARAPQSQRVDLRGPVDHLEAGSPALFRFTDDD